MSESNIVPRHNLPGIDRVPLPFSFHSSSDLELGFEFLQGLVRPSLLNQGQRDVGDNEDDDNNSVYPRPGRLGLGLGFAKGQGLSSVRVQFREVYRIQFGLAELKRTERFPVRTWLTGEFGP